MISNLTLKSIGQSLTLGQRSCQVKVGHVAYHSIQSDDTNILVLFSFVYHWCYITYWCYFHFIRLTYDAGAEVVGYVM